MDILKISVLGAAGVLLGILLKDRAPEYAMKGGVISLGGTNNGNGQLKIYDADGNQISRLGYTGYVVLNKNTGNPMVSLNTAGLRLYTDYTDADNYNALMLPILRKGSSGTAVAMLQAMLGVEVDGQFGNDTYNSLKVFQKNTGVTANGTCGIDTWKRVIEHMKANTK